MKLGFHAPLTKLYIFVKNEGNCLWYWLDDGRKIYRRMELNPQEPYLHVKRKTYLLQLQ